MIHYMIFDKSGAPKSAAYPCQEWAWLNFFKYQVEGCLERDQDKLKKHNLDRFRRLGYSCEKVIIERNLRGEG